ncbi:hypothetical protein ACQJBY_041877 [Aegilops geniculata]
MAGGGRRLSEVLREQQEPFLLHGEPCCSVADKAARASWGLAVRRALPRCRWDGLAAGCFPCAARHKRESFRPLPRAGHAHCDDDVAGMESDGARRRSPVSVLDVLRCSEEEGWSSSPTLSDWEEEEEEEDNPSSTPARSSPPPDPLTDEKTEEEWRRVVSSWERIAGDIARVPALAELDLSTSISMSAREWEWHGEAEAERVGARVEAIIFEEMSAEAVRDMVEL